VAELSRSIDKKRIVVGEPLPFAIYGADRKLLLAEGAVVGSSSIRDRLLQMGVFCAAPATATAPARSPEASLDDTLANPLITLSRDYADMIRRARFTVKIAPNESSESFLCWVIGVSHKNRCLVLTAPAHKDNSPVAVSRGQKWICRLFNSTTVFRFHGQILKSTLEPFPYIHVALPPSIERRTVREVPRAIVNLQGTLIAAEETHAAIVDLSLTGARIGVDRRTPLAMGDLVRLKAFLELLDELRELNVQARIVADYGETDDEHPDISFYGIKFESLELTHQLMLHAYVQERLVRELDGLGQLLEMDLSND
jgi:c-di-GMP-binding flagellar brake protein YcgR